MLRVGRSETLAGADHAGSPANRVGTQRSAVRQQIGARHGAVARCGPRTGRRRHGDRPAAHPSLCRRTRGRPRPAPDRVARRRSPRGGTAPGLCRCGPLGSDAARIAGSRCVSRPSGCDVGCVVHPPLHGDLGCQHGGRNRCLRRGAGSPTHRARGRGRQLDASQVRRPGELGRVRQGSGGDGRVPSRHPAVVGRWMGPLALADAQRTAGPRSANTRRSRTTRWPA